MGQYLHFGIATEIRIEKVDYSLEEMKQEINKTFPIEMFDHSEEEEMFYFNLKSEILEKHLLEFLKEQFENFKVIENEYETTLLNDIKKMTGEEIIAYPKTIHYSSCYQYTSDSRLGDCRYLFEEMKGKPFFQIDCWAYQSVGKTFIECTHNFFSMIRSLVEKSSQNPLAKVFYVDLQ